MMQRRVPSRRTATIVVVVLLVIVVAVLIQPWVAEFGRGMADGFMQGFESTQR